MRSAKAGQMRRSRVDFAEMLRKEVEGSQGLPFGELMPLRLTREGPLIVGGLTEVREGHREAGHAASFLPALLPFPASSSTSCSAPTLESPRPTVPAFRA